MDGYPAGCVSVVDAMGRTPGGTEVRAGMYELRSSLGLGRARVRSNCLSPVGCGQHGLIPLPVGDVVRRPERENASVESTARRMARGGRGNKNSADLLPGAEAPDRVERKKLIVEPHGGSGRHDVCSEAARLAARASENAAGPDPLAPPLPPGSAGCL